MNDECGFRQHLSPLPIRPELALTQRTKDGLIDSEAKKMIEKLDEELTKVIEDFERAVNVESFGLVKDISEHSLS